MIFYRQQMMIGGDFAMVTAVPALQEVDQRGKRRRRGRCNPTKEAQAWGNKRRAEEYFFYLIHENFTLEDNRLDLDFTFENMPKDEADLKRIMRNFIVRLRRRYEKHGLELRLVWVPEISVGGRYHVHGFTNGGVSAEEIRKAWKLGRANCSPFQYDQQGLAGYIHYVFKDPLLSKHWNATKNLKKPTIRKSDYVLRRKDVEAVRRGDLRALEQRLPGWSVIEAREEWEEPSVFNWSVVESEVRDNEVNGLPYLYIRLCRKNARLSW